MISTRQKSIEAIDKSIRLIHFSRINLIQFHLSNRMFIKEASSIEQIIVKLVPEFDYQFTRNNIFKVFFII